LKSIRQFGAPKDIQKHDGLSSHELERVYHAQLGGHGTTKNRHIVLSDFKKSLARDDKILKQDDRYDNLQLDKDREKRERIILDKKENRERKPIGFH